MVIPFGIVLSSKTAQSCLMHQSLHITYYLNFQDGACESQILKLTEEVGRTQVH